MTKQEKIFARMSEYKAAIEKGGLAAKSSANENIVEDGEHLPAMEVLFIAIKGSQNYGLETANSDIDCIAVVKPIKYSNKKISTKVSFGENNADEVDIKDLFTYCELIKKGNCSYIEPIYTQYRIGEIPEFLKGAKADAKSQYYMMIQKYKALTHPYPSKLEVLEKYGIDPKQMHHIERLAGIINRIIYGASTENFMEEGAHKKFLTEVKLNPFKAYEVNNKEELLAKCQKRAEMLMEKAKKQIASPEFPIFEGNLVNEEDIYNFLNLPEEKNLQRKLENFYSCAQKLSVEECIKIFQEEK